MRPIVCTAACAALVTLTAGAAWGQQEISPGETAEKATYFARPLLVVPGMPNPPGSFSLRVNGQLAGVVAPTGRGMTIDTYIGATDQLGINLRSTYAQLGANITSGAFTGLIAEAQYAVAQTADKAAGLSLVGAGIIPGGINGLNLAGVSPGVGIRGQATLGPVQTHIGSLYHLNDGTIDYGLSGIYQITEQIGGSIDILGVGTAWGGTPSMGIAPGIAFRLTPGIRVGLGYMVPVMGTPPQANQILAHLQLGI